jgi:hypothetical protein
VACGGGRAGCPPGFALRPVIGPGGARRGAGGGPTWWCRPRPSTGETDPRARRAAARVAPAAQSS